MSIRRFVPVLCLAGALATAPGLMAQGGHWEFGGHYGRWTLNLLRGAATDLLNDTIEDELQQRIMDGINEDYPNLSSTTYRQDITFDSSGDNFGASLRWYPAGRRGSFSLGVSVEKSRFKIKPTGEVFMDLVDGVTTEPATYDGTATGTALVKALSFQLTFRWDIFPSKAVHPYLTFGGGISTSRALDDSTVQYTFTGDLAGAAVTPQTVSGEETKTLRQLRDEAMDEEETDFPIPNFLPFIQLNLGLKVRLTRAVHILVDAGIFDGFMATAGLAIRL